jgi:hypothetical protein
VELEALRQPLFHRLEERQCREIACGTCRIGWRITPSASPIRVKQIVRGGSPLPSEIMRRDIGSGTGGERTG